MTLRMDHTVEKSFGGEEMRLYGVTGEEDEEEEGLASILRRSPAGERRTGS